MTSPLFHSQTQTVEMLKILNGMDLLGDDVTDKLTNEDAETAALILTKSKKRKRSKHKKQRTAEQ